MKRVLFGLAAGWLLIGQAFAADTSVPNMTAGGAMSDTDLIYCAQSAGTTDRKCTGAQVKTYANTSAVRATTTTSEALANSDQNKLVTFSNAAAVACTIAQAGSGGNFAAGWAVSLKNLGAGTVTCTPTTSTVDGAANFTLTTGQGLDLYSDGTNYFTQPGKGGVSTTGSPANGNLAKFSGTASITNADLTGDCTTSGGVATNCRQSAPVYIVNNWLGAGLEHAGSFATNSVTTNGSANCYPGYFHGPATITALGLRVATLSVGGNGQVAIYNHNAATGRPGTLVVSSASMSTTTATAVNATTQTGGGAISASIPGNQLLWWCVNSDNGTVLYNGFLSSFQAAVIGSATQGNVQNGSSILSALRYTLAFGTWPDLTATPATSEATTNAASPTVQFKIGSVP